MKKLFVLLMLVSLVCLTGCLEELEEVITSPEISVETGSIDFNGKDFRFTRDYVAISKDVISKVLLQYGEMYDGDCFKHESVSCNPSDPSFTGTTYPDGSYACVCWRDYGQVHLFAQGTYDTPEWQAFYDDRSGSLPTAFEFYDNGIKISADKTAGLQMFVVDDAAGISNLKLDALFEQIDFDKIKDDLIAWNNKIVPPFSLTEGDSKIGAVIPHWHHYWVFTK